MAPALVIRADANSRIGTGHVMRCLALAQAWQDRGGRCTFLVTASEALRQRLVDEGCEVRALRDGFTRLEDLAFTRGALEEHAHAWLVVDGYHFDVPYHDALKEAGTRMLVLDDDGHLPAYHCDMILNQNLHAATISYSGSSARRLLGPRFALLRREFLAFARTPREVPDRARKLLITMGGADPDNMTLKVLQAIDAIKNADWDVVVLLGSSNPHAATIEAAVSRLRIPSRIERDVRNMPELMAQADLAVSAAGSTVWELCLLGVPSLLVQLASNQISIARNLDAKGAAIDLGWHAELDANALADRMDAVSKDAPLRRSLGDVARQVVDGRGAYRVVDFLQSFELVVRRASAEDCRRIWEWANDAETRAASFSPEPIPWPDHVRWYEQTLADPRRILYLIANSTGDVGMVRYDEQGEQATVSINLASEQRGRGLGPALLRATASRLFSESAVGAIIAHVKLDNHASLKAFQRAGYRPLTEEVIQGCRALCLGLGRDDVDLHATMRASP